MQREITEETDLLDENGNISVPGWARKPYYRYDRGMIKAPRWRIKEWDYYCILTAESGFAITAADNGYMAFYSVSLLDLKNRTEASGSIIKPFPLGRLGMPSSSEEGDIVVDEREFSLGFLLEKTDAGTKRIIELDYPGFDKGKGLKGHFVLEPVPDTDSMVIATPFKKEGHFYYNQKINCFQAEGELEKGGRKLSFGDNAFGVLDWGRGVWTYSNTWYWGSASGIVSGVPFGFNIGCGFGDTSSATENIIFYNGMGHKLEDVVFNIPTDGSGRELYTEPWTFTGSDGRFEMTFSPVLDRASDTNLLLIRSCQHQVFGLFTGKAVLDDGRTVEIRDFPGFAEKVLNRW